MACSECCFYQSVSAAWYLPQDPQFGECRRLPPRVGSQRFRDQPTIAVFPVVHDSSWCGEFKPRTRRQGHEDRTCAAQPIKPDEQARI